jgi:arylsulfatase A-like enzyme
MLDLARVPPEKWPLLPGRSLVPALTTDDLERATFIENGRYWQVKQLDRAVWKGDMKLIHVAEDDTTELYDLAADPAEANDLAGQGHPAEEELRGLLGAFRRELRGIRSTKPASITEP